MARDDRRATEQRHRASIAVVEPAPVLLYLNHRHYSMQIGERNTMVVVALLEVSPTVSFWLVNCHLYLCVAVKWAR
jgi:hypothetical protein